MYILCIYIYQSILILASINLIIYFGYLTLVDVYLCYLLFIYKVYLLHCKSDLLKFKTFNWFYIVD